MSCLGLDTFAKVRALHDRTDNPGEKAAAAGRMEALARSAGMTVAEALSKLDTPNVRTQARAAADDLNDFFNTPFFRQARADRERERSEKWRRVLAEYGSEDAVFAPGPWESALEAACEPFVVRKKTTGWRIGSLWGWDGSYIDDPAPEIVEAIATAYPMPTGVRQAWVEFMFWDKLCHDREAHGTGSGDPAPWVHFRTVLVERQLDTLPADTLDDLRARLDWMDWRNDLGSAPDPKHERIRLSTIRADIERMGSRLREQDAETVQDGQRRRFQDFPVKPRCPDPGIGTAPVQSGHARRTNADKRRDVLALLNAGESGICLSDREIARRAGVSPQTVGNIRRSL